MVNIRYKSELNPWMDCIVSVPVEEELPAVRAIRRGVDAFFEEGIATYSEYIERELRSEGLHFEMSVCSYDEETDTPIPAWYNRVRGCKAV